MNIWDLPREHYNYESPITKIYGDIRDEIIRQDEENCTYAIKQAIGYRVDKDELIKALQYDRDQYDKGYKDGVKEAFIAELEKIKAEMAGDIIITLKDETDKVILEHNKTIYSNIGIIDKHISELKGGQQ